MPTGAGPRRPDVKEVRRNPAAGELWTKIYEDLSEEGGYGQAGAVTDRAEAQVLRLSLLYALADASESVGVPHRSALFSHQERVRIKALGHLW